MVYISIIDYVPGILRACTWLILILLPVFWAKRDSYASPSDRYLNKKWHRLGFLIRSGSSVLACPSQFVWIYGFYFWIVFDGSYNLFTDQNWWYVGTTADTDKATGKYNHLIKWVGLSIVTVLFFCTLQFLEFNQL